MPVIKVVEGKLNVNGVPDERLAHTSEARLKLLVRVVDRTKFEEQWQARLTVAEIASHWDITSSDVDNLRFYWVMPDRPRVSPTGGRSHPVDVDALSARLWLYMEPKIKDLVVAKVDLLENTLLARTAEIEERLLGEVVVAAKEAVEEALK